MACSVEIKITKLTALRKILEKCWETRYLDTGSKVYTQSLEHSILLDDAIKEVDRFLEKTSRPCPKWYSCRLTCDHRCLLCKLQICMETLNSNLMPLYFIGILL